MNPATSKMDYKTKLASLFENELLPALNDFSSKQKQFPLYEPIAYMMSLGGKRLRPLMVLAAADAYSGSSKEAIPAAMAVEVFHNFTLMHDDIMDEAPLRRGKTTVHEKWNANSAILSGDAMLVQAYACLAESPASSLAQLLAIFNQTALEVCEGQQLDMDFEQRGQVELPEYIEMIRLKTSVLLAAALKMGAIIGGANKNDADHLYKFGESMGLAFQLQDDFLDAFGDPEKFGKQVGGDIISDKKTYLWIRCMEKASEADLKTVDSWIGERNKGEEKVKFFKALFAKLEVDSEIQNTMESYYQDAMTHLNQANLKEEAQQFFSSFARTLMVREN